MLVIVWRAKARSEMRAAAGVCFHAMSVWRSSVARDSFAGFRPAVGRTSFCESFPALSWCSSLTALLTSMSKTRPLVQPGLSYKV